MNLKTLFIKLWKVVYKHTCIPFVHICGIVALKEGGWRYSICIPSFPGSNPQLFTFVFVEVYPYMNTFLVKSFFCNFSICVPSFPGFMQSHMQC